MKFGCGSQIGTKRGLKPAAGALILTHTHFFEIRGMNKEMVYIPGKRGKNGIELDLADIRADLGQGDLPLLPFIYSGGHSGSCRPCSEGLLLQGKPRRRRLEFRAPG